MKTYLIEMNGLHYIVLADSVIQALNHPKLIARIDSLKQLSIRELDAEVLS